MLFGNDRKQLRKMYFDAWSKHQKNQPLTPLEAQIVDVIAMHPEYHSQLDADFNMKIDKDYSQNLGEDNPFLHMGLHLGLREQLSTSRPAGIKTLFISLTKKVSNTHLAEHLFMEVLSEFIWQSQQSGIAPDDGKYIQQLEIIVKNVKKNSDYKLFYQIDFRVLVTTFNA